ncbi:hypothetical protein ABZ864_45735 [Streptomyces sp. NPDC047082]|uniref:hypothetical protein n=1 Tax=Streptomyces sp. NPDC047082 TaxID=3155259 RepID=UPI0033D63ECB
MVFTPEIRDRLCDLLREYEPAYAVPTHLEQVRLTQRTLSDGEREAERTFLEVEVSVTPSDGGPERWLLSLDFDEDARNLLGAEADESELRTAALIIFANVDEWWRCKDQEAATAAIGQRLA